MATAANWDTYEWNSAIVSGMKAANVPYNGQFGWVQTEMYWKVNHIVAPKKKALGYAGDPRKTK